MGKNWAITIGINNYSNLRHLKYAKADAEEMKGWFQEEAKFDEVFLFTEDSPPIPAKPSSIPTVPTYGHLRRFLRAQFEKPLLNSGDNLWFFFAGHGRRDRERDYLMLSDSDPGDVEHTAISVDYVTQRLRKSGADNVILFLDACRDESSRRGEGIKGGYKGIVTFYSCSPEQKAYEIDEYQQGSFTYALLEGLRNQSEGNCATVERLEQYLRNRVPQITNQYCKEKQNPYSSVEPASKYHLILLPDYATLTDIATLKNDAFQAEAERDWELAKQLWLRVNMAARGSDLQAIQAFERIERPRQQQEIETKPRVTEPVVAPTISNPDRSIKTIKIFLASSSELESDRQQFEIFINRKNTKYIKDGVFLELLLWEDFIDAMSATRLQDEYNKAVEGCDIFVSLFHTKVGKYTEEEFSKALKTFKDKEKPLIYTYFKDEAVNMSQITPDIVSLINFRQKLNELGHFYTKYNNVEDLKYKFSEQLIKVLPKLTGVLFNKVEQASEVEQSAIEQQEEDRIRQQQQAQELRQLREEVERLRPEQEYKNNLERYEQEFLKAVGGLYPLDEYVRNGLKTFQESLGLRDEDVERIEKPIIEEKEAEVWKRKEEERISQQQQAEELRRQREETERLRQQQETENRSRVTESVIESKPTVEDESLSLQLFEFDVVTVDERGEEVERKEGQAQYFKEDLGNGVELDMVYIPGDSFMMGSPEGEGGEDEKPQHKVTVQPFFMGKFQITQAQWRAISSLPKVKIDLEPDPSNFLDDDRPVEVVSWEDAVEFCQRLSKQIGREYRLPSEAEWEYACRAGTTTPFHFGETMTGELASYNASSYTYADEAKGEYRAKTTPVGSFSPNAFGLYDMHGQVWEWCEDDWHGNYNGAPIDGSAWISENCRTKVRRGGSWIVSSDDCRSAYRYFSSRVDRLNIFGFRVACVLSRTKYQQNLQQPLQLTDEELSRREKPIIEQKELEARKRKEEERIRQQQEAERLKQQQEVENRSKAPESVADSKPTNKEGIKLREFQFVVETLSLKEERAGIFGLGFGLGSKVKVKKNRSHGQAQYFREELGNGVGLDMVYIPGGSFMMGTEEEEIKRLNQISNTDWFSREKPRHEVKIQPFFMGKFQVTQAQWRAIASLPKVKIDLEPNPSYFKGDDLPIEQVSWEEAVEFCQRLSLQTRKDYRLPTEAEWEYACRAGTTTPFHFGETITGELANYRANYTYANEPKGEYREKTTRVGSFPPNAFGLYDLHGNVCEWCEDNWHDNYEGAPMDASAWTSEYSSDKVIRGGSWFFYPVSCRSAFRLYLTRENRDLNSGLRVVCIASRTT